MSKREQGWYWVRLKRHNGEYSDWVPAKFDNVCLRWYSLEFGGVPDLRLIIGDKIEQPPEFNQVEFDELVEKGTNALTDVPDATEFVEDLRGNIDYEMTFHDWIKSRGIMREFITFEEVWNAAIEKAALIAESQMNEPECPERAQYCADSIRLLISK